MDRQDGEGTGRGAVLQGSTNPESRDRREQLLDIFVLPVGSCQFQLHYATTVTGVSQDKVLKHW